MATFYVLASRQQLGQRFGDMLTALFPGTRYTSWEWPELADTLGGLVEDQNGAFIVYREDLDERLSVKDALVRDFGADLNDEFVEVSLQQPWLASHARHAA
jgi:hypothetical protein